MIAVRRSWKVYPFLSLMIFLTVRTTPMVYGEVQPCDRELGICVEGLEEDASIEKSKPSYALSTGDQDKERLTILNELHNSHSLSALKLTPGLRVLTLGCGIGILEQQIAKQVASTGFVLGTDISQDQLDIAQENASDSGLSNLSFMQLAALDIGQVPGTFDRIHCRFVLMHLPWEAISQLLSMLYDKLAPGGFLLLEDCATIDTLACVPPHPGYDKWVMMVHKQLLLQNSDTSPGNRIHQHLIELGWKPGSFNYQIVLSTVREKSILALGIESIASRIVQEGIATVEDIDEVMRELHELEQDPTVFPRYAEVIQIHIPRGNLDS